LCCKSGIGPLNSAGGNLVFDDTGKANLLNSYFSDMCVKDNSIFPDFNCSASDNTLCNVKHRERDILKQLLRQKLKMSSGPDGLPPIFYKKIGPLFKQTSNYHV
jgi:hypothetical protein